VELALGKRLLQGVALAGLAALGACGGGGGVTSTPAPISSPTPSPTPAPTPTPTPTPSVNYDTAEYRATVGAVSMNALAAYNAGGTGHGVLVGVIDSGIDLQSGEFVDANGVSRISAASTDTAGNASIDDVGGHGTAVAFTVAGRRNGVNTHGVAFDATLLVLRTDDPGSCTKTNTDGTSGCSHTDTAIARALDVATTNHARVVNISLGGSSPNSGLLAAMKRATQAGTVIVISAGNEFDNDPTTAANPDPFAATPANNPSINNGLIIIAGSIKGATASPGSPDTISAFSNRAGTSADYYLAAVGEDVRAPDETGAPFLWSGTSFAAPQISGAAALLAQAFPNLSGAEIVNLLLTTARDAGAPGTDTVYGRGILDLTRAFQPVGSTSVAGTSNAVSLGSNAMLSTPMGDARQGEVGAIILDGYSRAYALDLAAGIARQAPTRRLAGALSTRTRNLGAGTPGFAVAVSIAPGRERTLVDRLQLSPGAAQQARVLAASVTTHLGSKASFAVGASETGAALVGRLQGRADPAFLIARDPTADAGFDSLVQGSSALRYRLGNWGVTLGAEHGDALAQRLVAVGALARHPEHFGYSRAMLGVDRRFGGLTATLDASLLAEDRSLLGAQFTSGLGAARGDSLFVDLGLRQAIGSWSLGATWRQGWTFAHLTGLAGGGLIRSDAFAMDLGKLGVFDHGDHLGLRLTQPLRVASGGLALVLPSDYSYDSASVTAWHSEAFNLAPSGRELDMELSYGRAFAGGSLDANLYLRRQPGNIASAPDEHGVALRWARGF